MFNYNNKFKSLDDCLNISYTSIRTYLVSQHNNNKRQKTNPTFLVPLTFVHLQVKRENESYKTVRTLFDSGASNFLVTKVSVQYLKKTSDVSTPFNTVARHFSTNQKCKIIMKLSKLNPTAKLKYKVHVAESLSQFDLILGRDFLHNLGINLNFSTKNMYWNSSTVNTKEFDSTKYSSFHVKEEIFSVEHAD